MLHLPNSPRIRGDGPYLVADLKDGHVFSPYSRGWSHLITIGVNRIRILPVFAGMVPPLSVGYPPPAHSPRIRGDGPTKKSAVKFWNEFSPYSRGWSQGGQAADASIIILPVFAGMVPPQGTPSKCRCDSPRIRGDGPGIANAIRSVFDILPVFAGMVRWSMAVDPID